MGSKRGTLGSVCTSWYWIYRAVVSWGGFTCSTEIERSRSHVLRDPTPHPFFRMCFRIESFCKRPLANVNILASQVSRLLRASVVQASSVPCLHLADLDLDEADIFGAQLHYGVVLHAGIGKATSEQRLVWPSSRNKTPCPAA